MAYVRYFANHRIIAVAAAAASLGERFSAGFHPQGDGSVTGSRYFRTTRPVVNPVFKEVVAMWSRPRLKSVIAVIVTSASLAYGLGPSVAWASGGAAGGAAGPTQPSPHRGGKR